MIGASQSPRDRVLWILANNDEKMERSRLRRCVGVRYSVLDPLLAELAREGRIRIEDGRIMAGFATATRQVALAVRCL
jgi:hypothetical protein